MRFLAVALVLPETADSTAAVERLLEPYDSKTPAPPYKLYLSERLVKNHAARWGIAPDDLQALVLSINERSGPRPLHLLADEVGIYGLAQTNPNGKYKRWAINSPADDVWPVSAMPRELVLHAVITPDGQWHELFPTTWGLLPTPQDKQRMIRAAYALIDQYPGHLAVRLEYHV